MAVDVDALRAKKPNSQFVEERPFLVTYVVTHQVSHLVYATSESEAIAFVRQGRGDFLSSAEDFSRPPTNYRADCEDELLTS